MPIKLNTTTVIQEGRVGRPQQGDSRDHVLGVEVLSSSQVAEAKMELFTAPVKDKGDLIDISYTDIFLQLATMPEGFSVILPPMDRVNDHRVQIIQTMASKKGYKLKIRRLEGKKLLITIVSRPLLPKRLEALTPIQTEKLVAQLNKTAVPSLRPQRRYEMYSAYIKVLIKQHVEDLGAGVIYRCHDGLSIMRQQTRLHLEARYQGIKIRTLQLEPGLVLLTLDSIREDIKPRPLESDGEISVDSSLTMEELEEITPAMENPQK